MVLNKMVAHTPLLFFLACAVGAGQPAELEATVAAELAPLSLVHNASALLDSCHNGKPATSDALEQHFVCTLKCQAEETALERALQPFIGVKFGPGLWTGVAKRVCGRTEDDHGGMIVEVHDGQVFYKCCGGGRAARCHGDSEPLGPSSSGSNVELMLLLIREVAQALGISGVRFVFDSSRTPATDRAYWSPTPLVHWYASHGFWTVPFPSPALLRSHVLGKLGDAGMLFKKRHTQWDSRSTRVYWRGDGGAKRPHGLSRSSGALRLLPPARLQQLAAEHPTLFDVATIGDSARSKGWNTSESVDLDVELPHHKFVLGITEGFGEPPANLIEILAGGAVPLIQDDMLWDLTIDWLVPWHHYVPIRYDLGDLVPKIKWLKDNDVEAAQIAERAFHRFQQRIRRHDTYCYIWRLLRSLGSLGRRKRREVDPTQEKIRQVVPLRGEEELTHLAALLRTSDEQQ